MSFTRGCNSRRWGVQFFLAEMWQPLSISVNVVSRLFLRSFVVLVLFRPPRLTLPPRIPKLGCFVRKGRNVQPPSWQ